MSTARRNGSASASSKKLANPWEQIESKYPVGTKTKGRVVNLVPYGAFVELEPGVEGLVHVTELSWTKRISKPSDVLKVDQEVEAVVLGINRDEQKISLGIRQLEANPWDKATSRNIPRAPRVKGKIHRNLTNYGAFIEARRGPGRDDPCLRHLLDAQDQPPFGSVQEGRRDRGGRRSRSTRSTSGFRSASSQITIDPWSNIDSLYKVGDVVSGKVTKLASFGAFVGLNHDIDGLVHISQVSEERVDKIKNVLKVGQDVTARVIKIDKADRRIGLSIKAANYSTDQIKAEQAMLDSLKPAEDLVALQRAFDAADDAKKPSHNPGALHFRSKRGPSRRADPSARRFSFGDCFERESRLRPRKMNPARNNGLPTGKNRV